MAPTLTSAYPGVAYPGVTYPAYIAAAAAVDTLACRVRVIPAEVRTRTVAPEPRATLIPAETRERVITCPS